MGLNGNGGVDGWGGHNYISCDPSSGMGERDVVWKEGPYGENP